MTNRLVRSLAQMIPILGLACLCSLQGLGQARGTIVGTVTDSTGAVIPGATITATQVSTQISQQAVTSTSGVYAIPNLAVGTYNVKVEASGFKAGAATGITLDVSQTRNIDFQLVLASATQSVEVTAEAPLLDTTNATLAGLVTQQQVESLPLNGRSIQNLVMLQPGVAQDPGGIGWMAPQWVGNGNRAESAVLTLDGADASNTEFGTVEFWNFNLDAIAEFKLLQSNYSAEFGSGGGTITEMVSKEGGNQFHGSAFEFIRNNDLDARNYFSTSAPPPLQRNEFGATIGGPIIRRKTFFFGEYAGFRQLSGEPQQYIFPTAAEQSGQVVIGGYTYQVPLNSTAQEVLSKYPAPNNPNGVYGANTYSFGAKEPWNVNQYSIRIDHHISDHDSAFGRASVINNTQIYLNAINNGFGSDNFNHCQNFMLSETHIFTPALTNTGIFSVNRNLEGQLPADLALLTQYTDTNFTDGSLAGWGPNGFVGYYENTYYDPQDKLTWSKGRHLLTMGVLYRYGQDDGESPQSGNAGSYNFSPGTTLPEAIPSTDGGPTIPAGSPSPSSLVSMMEGVATNYSRGLAAPGFGPAGGGFGHWGFRVWRFATYLQDDYKVTPKLTLNLGLRYEYNSVPYEIENRIGVPWQLSGPLFGDFVLNPQPLFRPDKLNLAPRLGFAYALSNSTVVRGGAAIFTNIIDTTYADQAATDFPMSSYNTVANPATYALAPSPVSLPGLTSLSGAAMPPNGNAKEIPPNTPVNLTPISAIIGQTIGWWAGQNLKNGYTETANLTVEQKLPGDMALQASYVHSTALDLENSADPNGYTGALPANTPYTNITPGLGEFDLTENQAISHYNALQVQLRKISPAHGLVFQANYTYASDLSDADSVYSDYDGSGGITAQNPNCIRCEYGKANNDIKHRFVGNFTYAVPGRWGFMPSAISNGWQLLGIFQVQTGFPFNVMEPYGSLAYGFDILEGSYGGVRPNVGSRVTYAPSGHPQFFSSDVLNNTSTYFPSPQVYSSIQGGNVQAAPGNEARNTFTSPSWWNPDFSMIKDTKLLESLNMQFRAEFFNVFNHTQFATPYGVIGPAGSGFGIISSTNSATSERQIQFGLRFVF